MATREQLRERYIDELIGSSEVLLTIDAAAVAEAWTSSAIAEWSALEGRPGQLSGRLVGHSPLACELIGWMEGGPLPAGDAVWIADVGRHELVKAVQLTDARAPGDFGIVLEYVAPSGARHDLSVTIVDGSITGIAVGPGGLAMAATEDSRESISIDALERDEALGMIREALGQPVSELSAEAEATLPLVAMRIGLEVGERPRFVTASSVRALPERCHEDDAYAADVLWSSLRSILEEPISAMAEHAHSAFQERVSARDPDALTLLEVAGLENATLEEVDTFLSAVGAYLAPKNLDAHSDDQFAGLIGLEPADWLGVVLGIARADLGLEIDGRRLVDFINRAPEVTTTIPKSDAADLAWTFEQMLYAWEVTGVLTRDGRISEAARWLLPHAGVRVWS